MSHWKQTVAKLPTNSLLVSTPNHRIIRFYCPIRAECISKIAKYNTGDTVFIDGIYHDENHALLYLIDGKKLPHFYFNINN